MTLATSIPLCAPVSVYDAPVQILAKLQPQLFRDISEWIRLHPSAARVNGMPRTAVAMNHGHLEIRLNVPRPAEIFFALGSLRMSGTLVHLFDDVASFLQFLTQEGAGDCITHPAWVPIVLLPLSNATHLQAWLLKKAPAEWPWPLAARQHDRDLSVARPARVLAEAVTQMASHCTSVRAQSLQSQYSGRPTPAEILRRGVRPLRVLALASNQSVYQQYCARDIAQGLCDAGADAVAFVHDVGPLAGYEIVDQIASFDPDVLFLNGNGRQGFRLPPELGILSWDQDYALAPSDDYARKIGPRDRLMLMVADWQTDADLRAIPQSSVRHLNLGVNQRLYFPAAEPCEPAFDILFVGNIHPFDAYRKLIGFDTLDAATQRLMLHGRDRLTEWVAARGDAETYVMPEPDAFLRACARELGVTPAVDGKRWRFTVNYFRYRVAHLSLRQQYLEALTEFRLGLFGRGWEHFPKLAPFAQPPIENGPALREIIHKAAINVHLHTWTVHHPRLYDTAAAGGFLLVSRVPEQYPLDKVFEVGGAKAEVHAFGSILELKQKIRHYLANPAERAAIAARAAARARRDHSMDTRMQQTLKFLAEGNDDRA